MVTIGPLTSAGFLMWGAADTVDKVSRDRRSEIMRSIRGKDTIPEVNLRRALFAAGVRGWRLHYGRAPGGRPDVAFVGRKVAVLVHGCFFHGCPRHYRRPSSNNRYWDTKLERNRRRDQRQVLALRAAGWRVVRIWEHDLSPKVQERAVRRVSAAVLAASDCPPGRRLRSRASWRRMGLAAKGPGVE
jgi:DNA mismatch endonuclease (patch repair protein)